MTKAAESFGLMVVATNIQLLDRVEIYMTDAF